MGDKTGIEWTDATWNPIRGCSRVSEGCMNCYAETVANRFKGVGMPYEGLIAKGGQWNGKIKLVEKMLDQPIRWTKPRMVFVNSMSDLFHENVPEYYIDKIFAVMALSPKHTFQILTKRPERMYKYFQMGLLESRIAVHMDEMTDKSVNWPSMLNLPLKNVWLGVSVEDQVTHDLRIPFLVDTPAAVRWVSAEPLIRSVYFDSRLHKLDWVVVGGESGPNARPMNPEWAKIIRDQCAEANVDFFFKQWGQFNEQGESVGKKKAGSTLDGNKHKNWPQGL